jgi:hypothetical protein
MTPLIPAGSGRESEELFPGIRRYLRERFGEDAASAVIERFPSARESVKTPPRFPPGRRVIRTYLPRKTGLP